MRPANIERLAQAYIALNARTPKNKQLRLERGEKPNAVTRMLTRSGPLNIILTPAGTHGFDDLRRKAVREPLGFGVRTTLASLDDIIRATAAAGGKKTEARLPRLHRLLDLAQTVGPDPEKFPLSDPRHPDSCSDERCEARWLESSALRHHNRGVSIAFACGCAAGPPVERS